MGLCGGVVSQSDLEVQDPFQDLQTRFRALDRLANLIKDRGADKITHLSLEENTLTQPKVTQLLLQLALRIKL